MKNQIFDYFTFKKTACLLCSISLFYACSPGSSADQSGEWVTLFDGKTLEGWSSVGGKASYSVENDAIVGRMTKGTPNSFLVTEKEYSDFILELDIKLEGEQSNSGVQIRSHIDREANDGRGRVYGKQVEVDPTDRAWTGGIYDEARRGWLYTLDLNESAKSAYKQEEYNHYRIEAIGDETRTWVNGVPVAYVVDTIDHSGIIGLQVHSIPDELDGQRVFFKNIRIQTENLQETVFPDDVYIVNLTANKLADAEERNGYQLLFNGIDSDGWSGVDRDSFPEKGWQVEAGEIHVLASDGGESTNGGDIVTNDTYNAFDLSFEFRLTPGANSGVKYFVTLEEQTEGSAIGLEYQILDDQQHPDAKLGRDGNRTLASLYDLMGSDDNPRARKAIGEWNRGRVVVTPDNQVTHYLNGFKMLSYERGSQEFRDLVAASKYKVWENFGEASFGHILLQDHGDRVSFRSIKIKPL